MDSLHDDHKEDRSIEDYLFNGYKQNRKSNFELDQQFARPIEDEDLFGLCETNRSTSNDESSIIDKPFGHAHREELSFNHDDFYDDGHSQLALGVSSPGHIFEDESVNLNEGIEKQIGQKALHGIDDIFTDDYTNHEPDDQDSKLDSSNNENSVPLVKKTYEKAPPKPLPPSPAQVKAKRIREHLMQKARALARQPLKLGSEFNSDGSIEVFVDQHQLVSDSNSKFIFNKLFNKSKKASEIKTPEGKRKSWIDVRDSLRKRICSQKRKVWDSFQQPVDAYDDEEEIIEAIDTTEDRADDEISGSPNFADLEDEDRGDCEENDDDDEVEVGEEEDNLDEVEQDGSLSDDESINDEEIDEKIDDGLNEIVGIEDDCCTSNDDEDTGEVKKCPNENQDRSQTHVESKEGQLETSD